MDWQQLLQSFGYPIFCALACGYFIYKLVIRDKDEAANREKELNQTIKEGIAALSRVSATIEESNRVNKELSETNKILVDKMESTLNDMDGKIDQILSK